MTSQLASSSAADVASLIGLVVVHGIGNQRPGTLSNELAVSLGDPGIPVTIESSLPVQGSKQSDDRWDLPPPRRVSVGGEMVLIREAHWAPLSDPGNPLRVRAGLGLLLEFFDTIASTWNGWPATRLIRRLTRRLPSIVAFIIWAIVGVILFATLYLVFFTNNDSATGVFGGLLTLWAGYAVFRFLLYNKKKLRRASFWRKFAAVWVFPAALVFGVLQLLLPLIVAELLCFLVILVVLAVLVSWVGWGLAWVFVAVGAALRGSATQRARHWVHLLGWVIVGLPVHSLLLVTKAAGNLASIALTEKNLRPRLATVPWFVAICLGMLLLAAFCELLLLVPAFLLLVVFGNGAMSASEITGVVLLIGVFGGLYLLIVKGLVPMIDLLLDVENYHLGSADDRRVYQERVEKAVSSLRQAGCREIHILAHSLGSVITYDWLCAVETCDPAVAVLHTIGSPLNKFWYIDHGRRRRRTDAQGSISICKCRWINYWALSDPVSGRLARYESARVQLSNQRLFRLGLPLVSHTCYWNNPLVIAGIRDAIAKATHRKNESADA